MRTFFNKICFVFLCCLTVLCACFEDQIDPRNDKSFTPIDSLEGTKWRNGEWGESVLDFFSLQYVRSSSAEAMYVYSQTTRQGEIDGYGTFTISADNTVLTVYVIKYGHDLSYQRIE